jgi:preprotein translocase subunit SecG
MYVLLISLAIVSAILLVLVVLAQNSKGGGLSSQFGGSGASNLIGVKKTGDVLERLTWGFAIAAPTDEIMERAREQQQTAPIVPLQKPQTKTDSTKK